MAEGAPLRLGWFSTGRGEGSRGLLEAILEAIDSGALNARLEFVFCNRERGQHEGTDRFMDVVEGRGIPLATLSSQRFRTERGRKPWAALREDYDRAVMDLLGPFKPDLAVTAGYMLIAPVLCRHYTMINLHPALPDGPTGMVDRVIWEIIDRRASESGVMASIITEDVDRGPVLSYCQYALTGGQFDPLWAEVAGLKSEALQAEDGENLPLYRAIRQAGLVRERPFLVATLAAIADGRVTTGAEDRRTPLDLTPEVERAVRSR